MRRLRARLVTSHPGGPGTPAGRHYDRSARSSLEWDRGAGLASQEARPGAAANGRLAIARAAVERREANVPIARDVPRLASADLIKAPCGAPLPSGRRDKRK